MTLAQGVNLSERIVYSTLEGATNIILGYQIRKSLYLQVPEVCDEINLEPVT